MIRIPKISVTYRAVGIAAAHMLLVVVWVNMMLSTGPAVESNATSETAQITPVLPPITPGQDIVDVQYCNNLALDIHQPRVVKYEKTPVVIYIHGGGWKLNNKSSEPDQLSRLDGLRDDGFAVVSLDYRKMPDYFYPAPIEDSLCAVRFLRSQASTYYFDAEKFAVYGFSAGGQLAAMLGTVGDKSRFNTGQYSDHSSRVQAVVTLAAYLNFEQGLYERNPAILAGFMNGAHLMDGSPSSYVSPDDPPFLLIHGAQDQFVSSEQSKLFAAQLQSQNIDHRLLIVENAEHGLGTVGEPTQPSREQVVDEMHMFIKKVLGVKYMH